MARWLVEVGRLAALAAQRGRLQRGQPSRSLARSLTFFLRCSLCPLCLCLSVCVQMSAPKKLAGECKWFNSKKGFGFITPKDGSEEVSWRAVQCSETIARRR